MSDFLPHPFWNFSLELYAGEGVAEACLDRCLEAEPFPTPPADAGVAVPELLEIAAGMLAGRDSDRQDL